MCWKKPKDGKSNSKTTKILEVLMDDEEMTMQQLNKLCGNEIFFSYTRIPKRRMPIEVASGGIVQTLEANGERMGMNRETSIKSKILSHFIKKKISLSPMEIILMIPGEIKHLESPIKLTRRKRNTETTNN
jgi:hypothetical protein